jgi:predicted TIM-barrel fold metal-dependent hydrolase
MIIDIASHIITWEVEEALAKKKAFKLLQKNFAEDNSNPDRRIALMEKYGIDKQVLSQSPPILQDLTADEAEQICRMSNDAIGRIARNDPDHFIPFSIVSLLNVEAAVNELERSVGEWGCRGVIIGTNQNNMGLDFSEFEPFWQKVCELDIPVSLHPMHWQSYPLVSEDEALMRLFGWPFDTTVAIMRLVLSGIMERYPTLKIVTHHLGGGMLPFFSGRFKVKFENLQKNLQKPIEYSFDRLYGDTAVDGTAAALPCGHAFFGTERMVFGTDYPFSPENGELYLRENLAIVKEMDLPEDDKAKILGGNTKQMLKL